MEISQTATMINQKREEYHRELRCLADRFLGSASGSRYGLSYAETVGAMVAFVLHVDNLKGDTKKLLEIQSAELERARELGAINLSVPNIVKEDR